MTLLSDMGTCGLTPRRGPCFGDEAPGWIRANWIRVPPQS